MAENYEQPKHNGFITWKHSWFGRLVWLVLDLAIAAAFGTLAIDSGALWQWGLAIYFLGEAVYNIVRLVQKVVSYGKRKRQTTETR